MTNITHTALDVHLDTTVLKAVDPSGSLIIETKVPTKPGPLICAIQALPGTVHLTFEEGTQAAWLYDLLRPFVAEVIVCDPRQNKLLMGGNKSDPIDTGKLCELLRLGSLKPVYHGEHGTRKLKQVVVAYDELVCNTVREMNRIKALYRSRGIAAPGTEVYKEENREEWLSKLPFEAMRQRAVWLMLQRDHLSQLRGEALKAMLGEARRHAAWKLLKTAPGIGDIRAAYIVAFIDTPFRFRTKRQLWAYVGLAVVTRSSSDYKAVKGGFRKQRRAATRGLNRNHNPALKNVFKSAALEAIKPQGALRPCYDQRVSSGMKPEMARLTIARKIVAICLAMWKRGERYNPKKALMRVDSR